MRVGEPMRVTVSVHQKHKKFFDEKFKYGMIKVLLAEVEKRGQNIIPSRTINADFKTQQVCSVEADLEPGTYLIMAQACMPNSKPKIPN